MTAAADFPLPVERPTGGPAALWISAAALALAAHTGAALWALRAPPPPPLEAGMPAVTIELAAAPAAPPAEDVAPGDHIEDVQEIVESTPPPVLDQPPPDMTLPVSETAELTPPTPLTAPAADLPEVVLPKPSDAPVARPKDLKRVEPPREDKPKREEPPQKEAPQEARTRAAAPAAQAAPAPAAPANAASGGGGAAAARWESRLMAHLARRKRYPAGAKARREEGTALVRFSVDDGGHVQSVKLARSSGSADLDQAVVDLVRRASPVPAPPPGAPRSITVPVNFDLK